MKEKAPRRLFAGAWGLYFLAGLKLARRSAFALDRALFDQTRSSWPMTLTVSGMFVFVPETSVRQRT